MAISNSIMRYIGNEMLPVVTRNVAKGIGNSALKGLIPNLASKVGAGLAAKSGGSFLKNLLVNQAPSVAEKIPVSVGDAGKITLYRGIHANTPANLQEYIKDMKDPSIVPKTYTGNAFAGDGYHFYDNIEGARDYARDGINLGEPYGAVVKTEVPKNRFIGINSQNSNDAESFTGRALERGFKNASEVGNKNFRNYINRNGILGSHNTGPLGDNSQYVVMNNDATANLETIENFKNGELMKDVPNSGTATLGGLIPKVNTPSSSPDMMTLYRGLTQEYDPNYPIAKLDTSGYESWTDNPELARQYGDYVYSIDVPKADIKDSYLDENPNSPTYGDRNPIYSIDKKAGLNGISGKEYLLEVGSDYQKGLTYNEVPSELEAVIKISGADKYIPGGQSFVSPKVTVAENQASLFDQIDAPAEVKIRALNYLDEPINWAENNPAFNKLTSAQKQEFADLTAKKLGNNPTSYDVNQLFDPFYKNARKENGMALFNSEENQGFLNKLGVKDYTSMKGTLANDGEHTYNISNTTGLPYNEKITLNASVMEDMLQLQSTELHEAAHAAWLRLSPEQKISIGQDLCNKFGVDAKVGKRIANSNDLNELIAYSCEANFTSGNTVGSDGKLLDKVLSNSTAQRHLDNVAKMAGDVSPSFKERVMNVIRAFVDYIKAKIKGIKDIGTFDEFYDGLSSGDFAEDMATPIEKWVAPAKTDVELAKDELFNKLASLQKSRSIDSKAFLDIADMISPDTSIDYVMNYINTNYPDIAEKLTNAGEQRASDIAYDMSLSPQQQEFFKDSVVRDENGDLIPMYHGSNSDFTVFNKSKGGQSNKTAKVGFWFTPNKEGAEKWASQSWWGDNNPKVYETYLNIKNPYVYEQIDNSSQIARLEEQLKNAEEEISSTYRGSLEYYDAYKKYNAIAKQIEDLSYTDPYEQFRSHIYAMEGKSPSQANTGGVGMVMDNEDEAVKKYVEMLKNEGYDGIIIKGTSYDNKTLGGRNDQYVVFDPEQIKNVDNLNPTDNPDIRYATDSGKGSSKVDDMLDPATKRALEIINKANGFEGPVENELYNKIRPETLPKGYKELGQFLDSQMTNDNAIGKLLEEKIGTSDPASADTDKLLDYIYDNDNREKRVFYQLLEDKTKKWERDSKALGIEVNNPKEEVLKSEKWKLSGKAWSKALKELQQSIVANSDSIDVMDALMDYRNKGIRTGEAGGLDTALSERLGIAPGNTIKITSDDYNKYGSPQSSGRYNRKYKDIAVRKKGVEGGISTEAHERLHSFQNEARPENIGRYDKKVTDAFKSLSEDLKPFLKNREEIKKMYGVYGEDKVDYWLRQDEQEARMWQNYLENEGITRAGVKKEWGDEIKPAFDKFVKKLQYLSKAGYALPAIAALFGISSNNRENKEKTY